MSTMWSIYDLCDYFEVDYAAVEGVPLPIDTVKERIKKKVYDTTDCSVDVEFSHDHETGAVTGILLGAVVEGLETEFKQSFLRFPFSDHSLKTSIKKLEADALKEFQRILDECVFDHPAPWSIRTVARMRHEGDDPDDENNVEELTEVMASDGATVGYLVTDELAELIVSLVNKQWE